LIASQSAKTPKARSRNPARPGGQVSGDVAGRGRPGCAQVFHPRGRYALEPGCGAVLAGRWHRLGKRMPEVTGDKVFAIIEPQVRECHVGEAVECEVAVPCQAGEPQFMHCRFEREWREGKVVGLVAATTSIYQQRPLSARAKRCSVPVRHQQRRQNQGRSRKRPFPPCQRRDVRVRGLRRGGITRHHASGRPRPRDVSTPSRRESLFVEKRYIRKDGNAV
jgi:hypothetical protein